MMSTQVKINSVKARSLRTSQERFRRAKEVIPYGVNSNFRYWGDDATLIIDRGEGAYIWDVDGNRYIDYRLGFGPIILGHAHPHVNARVNEAIARGVTFASTTELEIEAAERITRLTGMEQVRLSNSGSEATQHALRIARAHTGREKFIKFEGNYHGNYDYVMYSGPTTPVERMGPRTHPHRAAATEGMPWSVRNYLVSLPYNDFEALETAMARHGEELAAVFVEPIMGNVAGITPLPGWLERIRELCDRYGVVLIFDEVKTGFRLANGGAQEYFGVRADLATYAKALGNGFPVSAIAGNAAIMAVVEPGRVAQGGTYCGNGVAAAAVCGTLDYLERYPVIESIFARGQELMAGLHAIFDRAAIPHVITGVPSMFSVMMGTTNAPVDYRSYAAADASLYAEICAVLMQRGIFLDDDPREPWFLSYSHDSTVIAETLTLVEDAVATVVKQQSPRRVLPLAA
ncbi:MAG TPA: guanitoxin biosynthesis PLP-dependent transaminase GntE [Caldilineaceae bacterium]|nr:guanitoxin biosynthesis PLP-dependent transaminase GntE [Caldilineaceae bacterium]